MQLPSNILCGLGHRFGEKMISEMSDGMHEISDGIQTRGRKLDDGNRVVQGAWDRVWKICWHFEEMDLVVRGDRERACRAMAVGIDCSVIAHLFPIETRSDRGNPRGGSEREHTARDAQSGTSSIPASLRSARCDGGSCTNALGIPRKVYM